jgi:hypothetical protein
MFAGLGTESGSATEPERIRKRKRNGTRTNKKAEAYRNRNDLKRILAEFFFPIFF